MKRVASITETDGQAIVRKTVWMDSVGCIDIGMELVVRRSDANREVVGRTEIVRLG